MTVSSVNPCVAIIVVSACCALGLQFLRRRSPDSAPDTRRPRPFRSGEEASPIPTALGDGLARLWYVNAAFLRFWGYESVQAVQGRWLFEFLDDPEQYAEMFCRLRSGGSWQGFLTARRMDSPLPARVYATAAHSGNTDLVRWTFVQVFDRGKEVRAAS